MLKYIVLNGVIESLHWKSHYLWIARQSMHSMKDHKHGLGLTHHSFIILFASPMHQAHSRWVVRREAFNMLQGLHESLHLLEWHWVIVEAKCLRDCEWENFATLAKACIAWLHGKAWGDLSTSLLPMCVGVLHISKHHAPLVEKGNLHLPPFPLLHQGEGEVQSWA